MNVDIDLAPVRMVLWLFLRKGFVLFSACQESPFALTAAAITKQVSCPGVAAHSAFAGVSSAPASMTAWLQPGAMLSDAQLCFHGVS